MLGIMWDSPEQKEHEWAFAKRKLSPQGQLLPNGTKLRRKDHPEDLSHSFMIMDSRIIALSGKGIHLGKGLDAHAKLAEDEQGNLIALKIITKESHESDSFKESQIASDLGIAGERVTRTKQPAGTSKKYIAYQYLGTKLSDFIRKNSLSLDKCYELCIKVSLALHELHTGKKTKSNKSYQHNDIHGGNLVIDNKGKPHFIDYGRAHERNERSESDIVAMLLLFFTPIRYRNQRRTNWILGDWVIEYKFSYEKPIFDERTQQYIGEKDTIYLYTERVDKTKDGILPKVHYMVLDLNNNFQNGVIDLRDLGFKQLPVVKKGIEETTWYYKLNRETLSGIENKILEEANQNNHIQCWKHIDKVLFNLLRDPVALYGATEFPTALDVAELLTISRLRLPAYLHELKIQPTALRIKIIHILNSASSTLLMLYEQINRVPCADTLFKSVKKYVISYLLTSLMNRESIATAQKFIKHDLSQAKQAFFDELKSVEKTLQEKYPESSIGFSIFKDKGLNRTMECPDSKFQQYFLSQLEELKVKEQKFRVKGHPAADCVKNLHQTLQDKQQELITKKTDIHSFQNSCTDAINCARPELEQYDGCKQLLGNLALAIIGVVILYIIAGLINKRVTGNFLFFQTNSANKIGQSEQAINTTKNTQ